MPRTHRGRGEASNGFPSFHSLALDDPVLGNRVGRGSGLTLRNAGTVKWLGGFGPRYESSSQTPSSSYRSCKYGSGMVGQGGDDGEEDGEGDNDGVGGAVTHRWPPVSRRTIHRQCCPVPT